MGRSARLRKQDGITNERKVQPMSERQYLRSQLLKSKDFIEVVREVDSILGDTFPMCLIGGLAVGYYSNPPVTVDIDFLVDATMEDLDRVAWHFEGRGWERSVLRFTHQRPGFPKRGIELHRIDPDFSTKAVSIQDVDLISTGGDVYLTSVVARAVEVEVDKDLVISVVTPEDLIVIKSLVGRDKDLEDIAVMERALKKTLDYDYIERMLAQLS
jgi:hypothetical protein